VAFFSLA
jgi:hypothetical protein